MLREAIDTLLANHGIPGASVAVADANGLRWSEGFGFADLASERRAVPETIYHLFSGTKLFTATAVVQLAERGKLSLDAPVVEYLPEHRGLAGITVRDLLSHQSGLRDTLRGFLAVTFPGDAPSTADVALQRYALRPATPPRTRVEYRNVNYALLGAVVSRVGAAEYADYVVGQILAPLAMEATFRVTPLQAPSMATGYLDRWDPMRLVLRFVQPDVARRLYGARIGRRIALHDYNLSTAAIGGLIGRAADFAKFLSAQLQNGSAVLSQQSLGLMQAMVARGAAGIASTDGVGLGWKHGHVGAARFLNHEGGGAGFTSELRIYPREGIAVVILMNAMRMPRTMWAAHHIAEVIRGSGG